MTNINTALRLSPQARLVLSMLEHNGSVTLAEAHEVYRVQGSSLAGRVRELRNHGLRASPATSAVIRQASATSVTSITMNGVN
jgi:hypothetical protein